MSYWILPESGVQEFCTTVQRVTKLEEKLDVKKEIFDKNDSKIKKRFKKNRLLTEKGDFPYIYE